MAQCFFIDDIYGMILTYQPLLPEIQQTNLVKANVSVGQMDSFQQAQSQKIINKLEEAHNNNLY